MNLLASLIGLLFLAEGLIGISLPGSLSSIGRGLVSPSALYGSGAVYVVFGVVQLLAASNSRLPRMIRGSGFVLIASGVALPFIGVTRVIAFVDWWLSLDPTDIRLGAFAVAAFGGLLVFGSSRLQEVEAVEDLTASGPHATIAR
jgi:hypothetical protein